MGTCICFTVSLTKLSLLHFLDPLINVKTDLGLLTSEASTALQASCILKELIGQLTDKKSWLLDEHAQSEVELEDREEVNAIKSMCATFESALSSCNGVPNEPMLSVISFLFVRLGKWALSICYMLDRSYC